MVEYGPLPDDRRSALDAILSYAFSPEDGPLDADEDRETPPQARVGENRALLEDGEIRSVCRHIHFDARVRGSDVSMAGLSAVATPPEHRRQGQIGRLLTHSLREYREWGQPIAALWPFSTPFYAQFGWATSNHVAVQTGDPDHFRLGDPPAGRYRRAEKSDWRALDEVLSNHFVSFELAVDRTSEWWHRRTFHAWDTDPYVYLWERNGDPAGYVRYTVESVGGEKRLEVSELAYVDPEARRAMLRFLADHDSQVAAVRVSGPPTDVLLDRVADPHSLEVSLESGPMVRIVDVVDALSGISYPAAVSGTVTVGVEDPLVDWNDDRFTVTFRDGQATVERTGDPADVEGGIGALSQLVVGHRTVGDLRRAGDLTVHDEGAGALLADAFPNSTPYIRERF
ncbi:MAG: enhanced intracellular survival protein Eis [Halanaeroarchaeum sp.]